MALDEGAEEGEETTGELLGAVARLRRRRYQDALAEYAVPPSLARALRTLHGQGPVRVSQLASWLQIARRSTTDVVDDLQRRGLVERVSVPEDRRVIEVELTPEGERLAALVAQARVTESEEFFAVLSDHDQAELRRLLRLLLESRS